jgi:ferrous iron transport protein B
MAPTKEHLKIALAGNPNSGKTSLFNELTGLNQKVGNYPGITVDKITGQFTIQNTGSVMRVEVTDLPGAYSLSPRSEDEEITKKVLTNKDNSDYPDAVIFVADVTNLKRSLFLCTQLIDLGLPTVLALNMMDQADKTGLQLDSELL